MSDGDTKRQRRVWGTWTGKTDNSNHHLLWDVLISSAAVTHPLLTTNSPLMISNITQSFVIALELNQHCSPRLALLSFNCLEIHILCSNVIQSQRGLARREGLFLLVKPVTLAGKYFACHDTVEEDLPRQPVHRKPWCIVGWHERLNGGTCLRRGAAAHLIMSVFVPACQRRVKTPTIAWAFAHVSNIDSHTFTRINTDTETNTQIRTRGTRAANQTSPL